MGGGARLHIHTADFFSLSFSLPAVNLFVGNKAKQRANTDEVGAEYV